MSFSYYSYTVVIVNIWFTLTVVSDLEHLFSKHLLVLCVSCIYHTLTRFTTDNNLPRKLHEFDIPKKTFGFRQAFSKEDKQHPLFTLLVSEKHE